jgi:hypothetical protein
MVDTEDVTCTIVLQCMCNHMPLNALLMQTDVPIKVLTLSIANLQLYTTSSPDVSPSTISAQMIGCHRFVLYDEIISQLHRLHQRGACILVTFQIEDESAQLLSHDLYECVLAIQRFVKKRPWIRGIDIDVRKPIAFVMFRQLIRVLRRALPLPFIIALTTTTDEMILTGKPGRGDFLYQDFKRSPEAHHVAQYHVQCAGCFDVTTLATLIATRSEEPQAIIPIMRGNEYTTRAQMSSAMHVVHQTLLHQPELGGVGIWMYDGLRVGAIEVIALTYQSMYAWSVCTWSVVQMVGHVLSHVIQSPPPFLI